MEPLAQRIRTKREEKGYSMRTLAQLVGTSDAAISNWENNINEPKASYILALAKALDTTADYLLGLSSEENENVGELATPMPRPSSSAESGAEPAAEPLPSQREPTRPLAPAAGGAGEPGDGSKTIRIRYAARGEGNLYADTTDEELRKLHQAMKDNKINPEDDGL